MDTIHKPKHYTTQTTECIEIVTLFCKNYFLHITQQDFFLLGNVVKYLWRAPLKGTMYDDLEKAENYLHRLRTGRWMHEEKDEDACGSN
jgi:hypothetical protein